MRITVATLGELTFGNLYDITFADGQTKRLVFNGVKRSNADGNFMLYFTILEPTFYGDEVGYNLSFVVIADEVEQ